MHMAATLSSTPIHGWPSNFPMASAIPCAGGIHRRVRRMLDDVKCVEKNPQRMRRIRQPPVSERVPGKQVAELVVHLGLRHGQPRQERHARKDRDRADGHYGEPLVLRELGKLLLHPGQNRLTQSRLRPDESQANRKNNPG